MHLSAHQNIVVRRLHTRLNALGLEPFSTVIKDHSTLIFCDSLNHDGSLRVYKRLR